MICEKCGFEYTSERCPVCAMVAQEKAKIQQAQTTTEVKKKSNLGLIGMLVSIASFVLKFIIPFPIPDMFIAIAGLVLSIMGKKKNKQDGYATAGLVISIIKLVLEIIKKVFFIGISILLTILSMTMEIGFQMFFEELFSSIL